MGGLWETGAPPIFASVRKRNNQRVDKHSKSQLPARKLQVRDLGVVKEDNLSVNEWCVGRVHATHLGAYDLFRMVDVVTIQSIIKRPVAKLDILPLESRHPPNLVLSISG